MEKFEKYLDDVWLKHLDEYQDIQDILQRYETLNNSNIQLMKDLKDKQNELETISEQINDYKSKMELEKTLLNNEITKQKNHLQEVENRKSSLMSRAQEDTQTRLDKTSEIG